MQHGADPCVRLPGFIVKLLLLDKLMAAKLSAALGEAGHQVTVVKDEKSTIAALGDSAFPLILINARGGDEGSLNLVRALRKKPAPVGNTYLSLLAQDPGEDYLVRAYDLGADAVLRTPCAPAVVLAHLKSAARLLGAANDASVDGKKLGAQAAPIEQMAQSKTWRGAQALIRDAASEFLTLEVKTAEAAAAVEPATHASCIMLSNVEHQLEIRIGVGADVASGKLLSVHMFGPEETDLVPDMLNEIANILMGTLKTAFSSESLAFTGGLPQPLNPEEVLRPTIMYGYQFAFAIQMAGATITVHLGIHSKANLFLPPAGLKEGMVLAKDVFNARGVLMLHAGTRLSQNMLGKIAEFLPEKTRLEVVAP